MGKSSRQTSECGTAVSVEVAGPSVSPPGQSERGTTEPPQGSAQDVTESSSDGMAHLMLSQPGLARKNRTASAQRKSCRLLLSPAIWRQISVASEGWRDWLVHLDDVRSL